DVVPVEGGVGDDLAGERKRLDLLVEHAELPHVGGDVRQVRVVLDRVPAQVGGEVLEQRLDRLVEPRGHVPGGDGDPVRHVLLGGEHGGELVPVGVAVTDLEVDGGADRLVHRIEVLVPLRGRDRAPQRGHRRERRARARRGVEDLDELLGDAGVAGGGTVHAREVRLHGVDRDVAGQRRADVPGTGGRRAGVRGGVTGAATGQQGRRSGSGTHHGQERPTVQREGRPRGWGVVLHRRLHFLVCLGERCANGSGQRCRSGSNASIVAINTRTRK